jgi:hypothetical protein
METDFPPTELYDRAAQAAVAFSFPYKKRNRPSGTVVLPFASSHFLALEIVIMEFARPETMIFVFLAVAAIALYSYLSVNAFVNGRRKERDAYYRSENVRRLTESQGAGADAAIALMREEDRLQNGRRLEGLKLGGLITTAVGVGMMLFLGIANGNHVEGMSIGIVPLLVGIALLLYAYLLAPKPQR